MSMRRFPWPLSFLMVAAGALTAHALSFLRARWLSLDPAVFEASTYNQGIHRALAQGSLWPWDLTGEFWPFLLMAPGIYLQIPFLAPFPGGYAPLVLQAVALIAGTFLVYALAQKSLGPRTGCLLGLAWLLHPAVGVGLSWGWSPYATAAPLLLLGVLCLRTGRTGWGQFALLAAASMKINVAGMVFGLGIWGWQNKKQWGRRLTVGAGLWILAVGGLFLAAAYTKFEEEKHRFYLLTPDHTQELERLDEHHYSQWLELEIELEQSGY